MHNLKGLKDHYIVIKQDGIVHGLKRIPNVLMQSPNFVKLINMFEIRHTTLIEHLEDEFKDEAQKLKQLLQSDNSNSEGFNRISFPLISNNHRRNQL